MAPATLRRIGDGAILVGIVGLALTVVTIALVAMGATEPPATIMAVVIPVQSVVNIAAGWNLRRQAGSLPG